MAVYRSQVILPFFTNLPTDVVVNQMHWFSDESVSRAADEGEIIARLQSFYSDLYGSTAGARVNYVDWPNATIKVFYLPDTPPRIPAIANLGFGSAGTNVSTIPTEVACVLSYQAAPASGVRYQSLYNRIYIGALPSIALQGSAVDNFPRFGSTWITQVQTAASNLLSDNNASLDWVQYGKGGIGGMAQREIIGGWVDDSPDTQRRRSVLASTRNTWT